MIAGVVGMLGVMVGIAAYTTWLLRSAGEGETIDVSTLLVPFAALFVAGSMVVVVFQSLHVANRVAGPEQRLKQTLQRVRRGDLSNRIHLRRGDLLGPLARECNELLDWLNANPPAGTVGGSDVVPLEPVEVGEPNGRAAGEERP